MANLNVGELRPKTHLFKIKHPATGETLFEVPDGESTKQVEGLIELVGVNSKEFYAASRKLLRDKNLHDGDIFELEQDNIDALCTCIVGWEDNGFFDETFTLKGAIELLSNPENSWLKDQIQEAVLEKANFFRK